jgi:uncharacterized protein YoxC
MDVVDIAVLVSLSIAMSVLVIIFCYFLTKNIIRKNLDDAIITKERENKDLVKNINGNTDLLNDLQKEVRDDIKKMQKEIVDVNTSVKYMMDEQKKQ